jgi:uncharacterized repeat protein (TIGR02543 family)
VDYAKETITVTSGYEVSTQNDGNGKTVSSGSTLTPGTTYYVRQSLKTNYNASSWTAFTVPSRPAAPSVSPAAETIQGLHDGKLTGVDSTMEYQKQGASGWTAISGTTVTGLEPGTYSVRVAATGSTFASTAVEVTVAQGGTATVRFYANNGTGTMEDLTFTYDDTDTLLTLCAFTRRGYTFVGWATSASGQVVYPDGQKVTSLTPNTSGIITLYAKWSKKPTYSVSGTVQNGENATIRLTQGSTTVAEATADSSGVFSLYGVDPGNYNLVATNGTKTVTASVRITDADQAVNMTMPDGNVSSVLEVKEKTPDVVVDKLDAEAQAVQDQNQSASTITVTMIVESKEEVTEEETEEAEEETIALQTAQTAIKEQAGSDRTLEYLEITVEQRVDDGDATLISETTNLMEIVVPFTQTSKQNIAVYRYHDGTAEALTNNPAAGEEGYVVNSDSITIYAKKFSTYAIGYTTSETEDSDENCPSLAFSDLDTTRWYHESVDYVLNNGIMEGYGNGTFGPGNSLTRAQLAQILYNLQEDPQITIENPFTDVDENQWYAAAVIWAYQEGVVEGYGNGKFGPEDKITRQDLAVMLWRYAGEPTATQTSLDFTDAAQVSDYAQAALLWANEVGIVQGDNGVLRPKGNATRTEAAAMIMRYLKLG